MSAEGRVQREDSVDTMERGLYCLLSENRLGFFFSETRVPTHTLSRTHAPPPRLFIRPGLIAQHPHALLGDLDERPGEPRALRPGEVMRLIEDERIGRALARETELRAVLGRASRGWRVIFSGCRLSATHSLDFFFGVDVCLRISRRVARMGAFRVQCDARCAILALR